MKISPICGRPRHHPSALLLACHFAILAATCPAADLAGQPDLSNATSLPLRWSRTLPAFEWAHDSIAFDGESTLYLGGTPGIIHAIDSATGATRWSYDIGGAMGDDAILIGSSNRLYAVCKTNPKLVSLDSRTGDVLWERHGSYHHIGGGPDDFLYTTKIIKDVARILLGMNAPMQETKWLANPRSQYDQWLVLTPPSATEDFVYVGADKGAGLLAFDSRNGTHRWSILTWGAIRYTWVRYPPVIDGAGTLYLASEAFYSWSGYDEHQILFAVNGEDGGIRWQHDFGNVTILPPSLDAEGTLLVHVRGSAPAYGHTLYGLDSGTGHEKWSLQWPQWLYNVPSAAADGTVYVGTWRGLLGVDGHTGKIVKWGPAEGNIQSSPIIAPDGTIYVVGDQTLYAFQGSSPAASSPWPRANGGPRNTRMRNEYLPEIRHQPSSHAKLEGQPMVLAVDINAFPAAGYQWFRDGRPLDGATTRKYAVPSVSAGDEGRYHVVVSNKVGVVSSQEFTILVSNVEPVPRTALSCPSAGQEEIIVDSSKRLGAGADWTFWDTISAAWRLIEIDEAERREKYLRARSGEELAIGRFNAIPLSAPVGTAYRIDFADDQAGDYAWRDLTNIVVTTDVTEFVDLTPARVGRRQYRLVEQ